MNSHINSAHKGMRYACPFCEVDMTAKSSIKRHIQTAHKDRKNEEVNIVEHEYLVDADGVILSEQAKLAQIKRLTVENAEKDKRIEELEATLKQKDERIAELSKYQQCDDEGEGPSNVDRASCSRKSSRAKRPTKVYDC